MFDLCHYQTYDLSLKTANIDASQSLLNIISNYTFVDKPSKIECSDLLLCDIIYLTTPFTSAKIYIFAKAWILTKIFFLRGRFRIFSITMVKQALG